MRPGSACGMSTSTSCRPRSATLQTPWTTLWAPDQGRNGRPLLSDPLSMTPFGSTSPLNDEAPTSVSAGRGFFFYCAPEGIRTPNLLIRSQMLYPLSYGRWSYYVLPAYRSHGRPTRTLPPVRRGPKLKSAPAEENSVTALGRFGRRAEPTFRSLPQKRPRASRAAGTFLAETEGFEPSNGLPRYHLSRVAH
jgi:hypothetical protein